MEPAHKKVLVVEDDDMLRNIIVDQLKGNFHVLSAADGELAVAATEAERPDMIILDLLLPKLDGFEFLKYLRNMPNQTLAATPVLVVSNLADPDSIRLAQKYGVSAYFTKADISLGTLIERIKTILSVPAKK